MLVLFFLFGDLFLDHDERNVCYAFSCLVISKPRKGSNVWFAGPSGPQRVVTESQLVPSMASGFAGSGTGQTSHLEPVEARHCATASIDPCYLLLESRRSTASLCYSRFGPEVARKTREGERVAPRCHELSAAAADHNINNTISYQIPVPIGVLTESRKCRQTKHF